MVMDGNDIGNGNGNGYGEICPEMHAYEIHEP